jgi:hypothetical protein
MKTAVEWLVEQITDSTMPAREAIEQAKEMEKEQIIEARINGDMNGMCIAKLAKEKAEKYYNETYKNTKE